MKINTVKNIFLSLVISMGLFLTFSSVNAQQQNITTDYAVLVPLPGTTVGCNVTDANGVTKSEQCTDLSMYLPRAFQLTIGIAVALAFVVIVYGGVLYATSDALSNKSAGREAIENALWGLLLVIGSYVILQTINPRMLDFTLDIQQFTTNPNTGTGTGGVVVASTCCHYDPTTHVLLGYTLTPAEQQQNSVLLAQLQSAPDNVEVNAGPCTTGGTRGCTNIVGLPQRAITRLKAMKAACTTVIKDCYIQVTGGAEGGHATHGPNIANVDVSDSASLRTYFAKTNPQAKTPANGTVVNIPGGGTATYETTGANGRASGNHWHIQF